MMSEDRAQSPVPVGGPLMRAWNAYNATAEYANSWKWAEKPEHRAGSMWAAFEAGYRAAGGDPFAVEPERPMCGEHATFAGIEVRCELPKGHTENHIFRDGNISIQWVKSGR